MDDAFDPEISDKVSSNVLLLYTYLDQITGHTKTIRRIKKGVALYSELQTAGVSISDLRLRFGGEQPDANHL